MARIPGRAPRCAFAGRPLAFFPDRIAKGSPTQSPWTSHIEPSCAEPGCAEPSCAVPIRAESSCTEPSGAESCHTEPSGVKPRRIEQWAQLCLRLLQKPFVSEKASGGLRSHQQPALLIATCSAQPSAVKFLAITLEPAQYSLRTPISRRQSEDFQYSFKDPPDSS